jgi:cellulose synthase operon protein C
MIHLDELLSAYLDGEATPAEAVRVEHHLADCHRCRIRLTEINAARTAVRSLPMLELPSRLVTESRPTTVSPMRRPMVWVGAAAALAASVITVATITTPPPEPLSLADVSRQFGARAALDVGTAPLKMVVPSAEVIE